MNNWLVYSLGMAMVTPPRLYKVALVEHPDKKIVLEIRVNRANRVSSVTRVLNGFFGFRAVTLTDK